MFFSMPSFGMVALTETGKTPPLAPGIFSAKLKLTPCLNFRIPFESISTKFAPGPDKE